MEKLDFVLKSPLPESYKAYRLMGIISNDKFDELETRISCDAPPSLDESWNIGVIYGQSGCGKTSVARKLYGSSFEKEVEIVPEKAVIDNFEEYDFDTTEKALSAVGFGSPVRQLLPFEVLSGGEKFRVKLAKTLLDASKKNGLAVVDEFASVLDGTTQKCAALSTRRALDSGFFGDTKLVVISGKKSLIEELEADWCLNVETGELKRGRLRRKPIKFNIKRCSRDLWGDFKKFHYLSGNINPTSTCYIAENSEDKSIVAFCAIIPHFARIGKGFKRISRLVVKPEYQGYGIGGTFMDAIADFYDKEQNKILKITTGLPFFIKRLDASPLWERKAIDKYGSYWKEKGKEPRLNSFGRAIVSFEYKRS